METAIVVYFISWNEYHRLYFQTISESEFDTQGAVAGGFVKIITAQIYANNIRTHN